MPRFALAGNNLAAVHTLDLLLEAVGPEDILVIAPDPGSRPEWQRSLAAHATHLGVECVTPPDVNAAEIAERVAVHDPALFLSVYYTQIFRGQLMETIRGKALNFHPSLLPRHRGNAPVIWSIAEGDRMSGVSVHHIDEGIDTGRLVLQRSLPIHENDTGYVLHQKLANLVRAAAGDLIREFMRDTPLPEGREQTGAASSHSQRDPRINHLDWSLPRERIRNIVRALAPPLPGAFSVIAGETIVFAQVEPVDVPAGTSRKPPGMISVGPGVSPIVWAGDGALRISTVAGDDGLEPGSNLVESGRLIEGNVLD